MAQPAQDLPLDALSFLAWDETQDEAHEYVDGLIVAMSGGSARHALLEARLIAMLSPGGGDCVPYSAGLRIAAVPLSRYYYADVSVVCGPVELEPGTNALRNPSLLIEVLSGSTEGRDRGEKWLSFQQLASLQDYLLVSQRHPQVEHFHRHGDGWVYAVHGIGAEIKLATIGSFSVATLYQDVWGTPGDV